MKLCDAEKTLLILLLSHGYAQTDPRFCFAVETKSLEPWFDRPSRLKKAAAALVAKQLVHSGTGLRMLIPERGDIVEALRLKPTPDLFLSSTSAPAHATLPSSNAPAHSSLPSLPSQSLSKSLPNFADKSPKKPNVCGTSLPSLPNKTNPADTPKGGAGGPPLNKVNIKYKGIKPLTDLELLKDALHDLESGHEETAYTALCGILGGTVMHGGDPDPKGGIRTGDGGKWRNRWRISRHKTHRVMAELIIQIAETHVKNRGAKAEYLWQDMMK